MDHCPNIINELRIDYTTEVNELSSTHFNILHVNTRSCRNKIDELTQMISELKKTIHVIVFSETWLYENEICNITDYNSYHSCRKDRGGGVSIFVLGNLKSQLTLNHHDNVNNFLIVDLIDLGVKVMGVYNPGREVNEFLDKFERLIDNYENLYICGDFNINLLDGSNDLVQNYRYRVESLGFVILNSLDPKYATRISNTISTTIDHFITNQLNSKMQLVTKDTENHLSDHKTLILSIEKQVQKPEELKTIYVIHYDRFLNETLQRQICDCQSFEHLTQKLSQIVSENKEEIVYKKSFKIRKPYINTALMRQVEMKNRLYKSYKNAPCNSALKSELYLKYVTERNKLRNKTKTAKENYYKQQIESHKNNAKATWDLLRQLIFERKTAVQPAQKLSLRQDGVLLNDDTLIANRFNEHFINIGRLTLPQQAILGDFRSFMTRVTENDFRFYRIEEDVIKEIIDNLNSNAACGLDKVSVKFLQKCKNYLVSKMVELINNMIDTSSFDDVLKQSKVIPLFKSGDKLNATNYRPISILPALSKISEKVIHQQLTNYLFQHQLIHSNQFGFIPKSSTESATLELVNFLVKGLDDGQFVACIFIDLQKAFDCIPHDILIEKIRYYGFSNQATELLRSYISNRQQVCCVNDTLSNPMLICTGVPQGSILGPMLFNIFINDLLQLPLKGILQCYADDAASKYRASSLSELKEMMQHDLNLLHEWFNCNRMSINVNKSNFMLFTLSNEVPEITLSIDDKPLQQVYETNYLGLVLDSKLKWQSHIQKIKSKIIPFIFSIKKVRKCIGLQSAWLLYYSYILPHLTYLICLWGSAASNHLNILKVLQNRVIKIIKCLPVLFPSNELYSPSILPLNYLHKYSIIYTIYKIKNGFIKHNFELVPATEVHSHFTRQRERIYTSMPRTELAARNIFYSGVIHFNLLPQFLKQETNIVHFKRNLKKYVFENGV